MDLMLSCFIVQARKHLSVVRVGHAVDMHSPGAPSAMAAIMNFPL